MYLVYSFLLTLGFLILAPRLLFHALRHGKYLPGFRERLGTLTPLRPGDKPVVWLHCVSVGEAQAARPLVQGIRHQFPNHRLAVSTTTLTGQNLAREVFKNHAEKLFYFPFDWRWTVRRSLKAIKPAAVLIMETELWPNFIRECRSQQIPLTIVNGRLSERSFRRYRLIRGFISRVLKSVDLALMQTEADAARIINLGLPPDRVVVSGSLKFDAGRMPATEQLTEELRLRFNPGQTPLILAASTHAPEERLILGVFRQIRSHMARPVRLMLAPRHPERFSDVASLIQATGLTWTRRTATATESDAGCEVILLDTIGELLAAYPLAAIVFVGGSLAKTGGHNILEPAAVGACIVTGPYTYNFETIVKDFAKSDALIQLPPMREEEAKAELITLFGQLLEDEARREALGRRARDLVQQNLGATELTLWSISSILTQASTPSDGRGSFAAQNAQTA
jgi:3-deoxy-D-manno-octulosonic-acid transferase